MRSTRPDIPIADLSGLSKVIGLAAGEARPVHLESAIGRTLTQADADQWLMLMENNEIARAPRGCAQQGGRQACSFVFWDAPAPPPGVPTQAASAATPGKH